jgi:protein phosphatase 2C family protein 2/3
VLHEVFDPSTDEFLVLACDGVWDVMTTQQVVSFVRRRLLEHGDPQQAAEELTQKALDLNSIDNVTAIVVCLPNK